MTLVPDSAIRTFFLRNEKKYPVACVATLIGPTTPPAFAPAFYTLATCNPRDQFDKSRGRHIAIARLRAYKNVGIVNSGPGLHRRIVQRIAADAQLPLRTRKAALLWLASRKDITNDPAHLTTPPPMLHQIEGKLLITSTSSADTA